MVSRLLALILCACSVVAAAADPLGLSADAIAHPERYVEPTDVDTTATIARLNERDRAAVQAIAERTTANLQAALPQPAAHAPERRLFRIFLSQSMARGELASAFTLARDRADVVLVFRGPKPDQSMAEFMRWIRSMLKAGADDAVARVEIDPPAFRRAQITAAPTLVRYASDGTTARVAGLLNPAWLDEHATSGATEDLGVRGRVNEIVEVDLEDQLRARAQQLDWNAMKRAALDRYVRRIANTSLPTVVAPRERRLDPSFVVTDEVVSADGTTIARPGQRINPLALHAFRQLLVVIDAGSDQQVALARAIITRERSKRRVTVLAAGLEGADQLERVRNALDHPVYLLDATVRTRFAIEAAPTTVEADGDAFIVRELVPRGDT